MNWLTLLLKYGPFAFRLIRGIIRLIEKIEGEEKENYEYDLVKACNYYKMTKDKTRLKNLEAKIKKKVFPKNNP